jgi:hypothetical protein
LLAKQAATAAASPAHLARQDPAASTARTADLAPLVPQESRVNVALPHATPRQFRHAPHAQPDLLDPQDPLEMPESPDLQESQASLPRLLLQVSLDPRDHQGLQDRMARMDLQDPQALMRHKARLSPESQDQPEMPDHPDLLDPQALLVPTAVLASPDLKAPRDPQAPLELTASPESLDPTESQARLERRESAPSTAHWTVVSSSRTELSERPKPGPPWAWILILCSCQGLLRMTHDDDDDRI